VEGTECGTVKSEMIAPNGMKLTLTLNEFKPEQVNCSSCNCSDCTFAANATASTAAAAHFSATAVSAWVFSS